MEEDQPIRPHDSPDDENALRPLLNDQKARSLMDLAKSAALCARVHPRAQGFNDVVMVTAFKMLKHLAKAKEEACTLVLATCIARHAIFDLTRPHKIGLISAEEAQRFDPDVLRGLSQHSLFQDHGDDMEEHVELREAVLTRLSEAFAEEMRSARYWHGSRERRTRKQTALSLGISERTVDKHMSRLRAHAEKELSAERRQLFGPRRTQKHTRNRRRPIN